MGRPLVKHFDERIVYDAGSNLQAKVSEFLMGRNCDMSTPDSRDLF